MAEALPEWPEGCALQTIDGSYNALTNIDVLKNMEHLTHIYMDYNLLTNIDALAENFCLVQVNVYGNEIPDVEALRDHDIIVNYDPTVSED
jgi:Leucine-rich repeat (LRR) protein